MQLSGRVSQQGCGDDPATGTSVRPFLDTMFSVHGSLFGGKYDIKKKIELYKGSVSTVYKCMLAGGKPVVIKTYHKVKMADKHFHKLEREIGAMRALCREVGKKGVVQLLDAFDDAHGIYLVMECCEGGDLFKRLMLHGGKLPEQWVCVEVIAPLLRVLDRMHELHIMHRDIKPENIFITADGKVKLGDFGLAIDWTKELPFSRSGTLDYMAPEVLMNPATHTQESPAVTVPQLQSKNIRPYTSAVDVWAVGCLAYELVCGKPPFEVEDEKQTASLIIYSNTIHFDCIATPAWADFVTQALVKDPRMRPTAAALLSHTWVRSNLERAAPAPATMLSSAVSYGRSSCTPRTPEGADAQPLSDRSGMLRAPPPVMSASVAASVSSASACGTGSVFGDNGSSTSANTNCVVSAAGNGIASISSPAPHKQQTQTQRTCTTPPSNTAHGFRTAAAMLATRGSQQSPTTPPSQPPAAAATAMTPPVTGSGAVHGSIASAQPPTWSAPQTQTTAVGYRGSNAATATPASGISNGALRSLLDAFKSASICNGASATNTASYAERVAPVAPATNDAVAAGRRAPSAGSVHRCSSAISSANINTNVGSGTGFGLANGSAFSGQLLRASSQFQTPPEQEAVVSDGFHRKSFHVQIPSGGLERDRANSSAGGSSTAAVVGYRAPLMQPPLSASQLRSAGLAPASAREPGIVDTALRSSSGITGPPKELVRPASATQLSPQQSIFACGGEGVASEAGAGPSSNNDRGSFGSSSWSSRTGAATTGGLLPSQCTPGTMLSARGTLGSLSSAGICGRAASPQRPELSQTSGAMASTPVAAPSTSHMGKPPRPQPDSPGRALTPVGGGATTANAAPPSCSASPRWALSYGSPQLQQQPASSSSCQQQHRAGEWEKQQQHGGPGAIASPSTLHELTRNWGAVVSVSVGKLSSLVGSNRHSGSGSAFSSPQRLPVSSSKGLDSYGLPPPTPGASALSPAEYYSPRPVGVLERVKYHLRGGSVGSAAGSSGRGGNCSNASSMGGAQPVMQQQQQQQQLISQAAALQASVMYGSSPYASGTALGASVDVM